MKILFNILQILAFSVQEILLKNVPFVDCGIHYSENELFNADLLFIYIFCRYWRLINVGALCDSNDIRFILGCLASQLVVRNLGRPGPFLWLKMDEYSKRREYKNKIGISKLQVLKLNTKKFTCFRDRFFDG